ncbi:Txe/YoeB family addiction module toxin [Escherichia coli]|nr:Txe/YoeB family addiction module toxin [Escherichia coli]
MNQLIRRSAVNLSKWTIKFTKNAADDINFWRESDPKKFERIRQLLHSLKSDPLSGIGKPERLRHHKTPALYSRRIDHCHRLVYSLKDNEVIIYAARYHYTR